MLHLAEPSVDLVNINIHLFFRQFPLLVMTDYSLRSCLKLLGIMIVSIQVCTKYIHYRSKVYLTTYNLEHIELLRHNIIKYQIFTLDERVIIHNCKISKSNKNDKTTKQQWRKVAADLSWDRYISLNHCIELVSWDFVRLKPFGQKWKKLQIF